MKPDRDAWLRLPQPTMELCRLYHGIGCKRGCAGYPAEGTCYHACQILHTDGHVTCIYCKEELKK